jgi:hypothetical protein
MDIENQKIETRGINFFAPIQNMLRKIQKRYNVFFGLYAKSAPQGSQK